MLDKSSTGGKRTQNAKGGPKIIIAAVTIVLCLFGAIYIVVARPTGEREGGTPAPSVSIGPGGASETDAIVSAPVSEPAQSADDDELWKHGPEVEADQEEADHSYEENVRYCNDTVLTCVYNERGDTISLGIDLGRPGDMIYLDPRATVEGRDDAQVGFYITTSRVPPLYQEQPWESRDSGKNDGETRYIIRWTYDEAICARYQNESSFGIGWKNDILYDGKEYEGTEIYIRAVDFTDQNRLIAVCKAEIAYEQTSRSYRLVSLEDTDVSHTCELSSEERAELLSRAYDLAADECYSPNMEVSQSLGLIVTKEEAVSGGIVEHLGSRMYFDRAIDRYGAVEYSRQLIEGHSDIFAVSLPVDLGGFITMYYSPDASMSDLDAGAGPVLEPVTSMRLSFFATDAFDPRSQDIWVPSGFFSSPEL